MAELFNENYYKNCCGLDYSEENHWIQFFGHIADRIVADLNPKIVLDAGCAWGYLVAALRDRGVEAYGVDISSYAISKVREDVKPYCEVCSLTDPLPESFPEKFDLVTNIEVLEHMYEDEGINAIRNLCTYTDSIIFSSSSDDVVEATHVNVQQPEYWVRHFAENGFFKQIDYIPDYISAVAMCFSRNSDIARIAEDYERNKRISKSELEEQKNHSLDIGFTTTLFLDFGNSFHAENAICTQSKTSDICQQFNLEIGVKSVRFDPVEGKGCIVQNLEVLSNNGPLTAINLNGIKIDNFDVFTNTDPQFLIDFEGNPTCWIKIKCTIFPFEDMAWFSLLSKFKGFQDKEKELESILEAKEKELESILEAKEKELASRLEAKEKELASTLETKEKELASTLEAKKTEQSSTLEAREIELETLLTSILNSQSWRLTRPLRAFGRFVKPLWLATGGLFDIIKRRRFVPQLEHVHQIDILQSGAEYRFKSTGNDPQFHLQGRYPRGWVKIFWEGAVESPMRPILYVDRGQGLNTYDSVNLGIMLGQEIKKYEVIVHLGNSVLFLRLDPGEISGQFTIRNLKMIRISRMEVFLQAAHRYQQRLGFSVRHLPAFSRRALEIIQQEGFHGLWLKAKNQVNTGNGTSSSIEYEQWLQFHTLSDEDIERLKKHSMELPYKPVFSLIVPVYNIEERWLRKCLDSVLAQVYPYWELCISDDASTKPHVRRVLEEYRFKDERIKIIYREKNGHISVASNSALELASGDFVALLDNDDELTVDALYENALLINEHPKADMIYSDEDKISEEGRRHSPFFKPDWSPDTFLSQMYTCHLGVYRRALIEVIGGFRVGLEGSQDYDLVLRLTERTKEIYHITKVLYHWRTIAGSTATITDNKSYAFLTGERAIHEALERRGENGWVEPLANYPGHYRVHYPPRGNPMISIIIPTRDLASILSVCLKSIFEKSTYKNFEVIIVDNGSREQETFDLFDHWQKAEPEQFRVLRLDIPFNYSKLNNEAARTAKGELLLLLNNDIEVITPNWLEEMAGQALRPSIGAVGAVLFYPDDTIQHAGVVLGVGGVAGHSHKGIERYKSGYFDRLLLPANYSAVTGACLMIKKSNFWSIDGLEERLSVAFNDVDFCLKIGEKSFYNVVLPQVQLYHHESKSRGIENTPEKQERFLKEIKFMQDRWGYILRRDPFYNPNLTLDREDFTLRSFDKII